MALPPDDMAVDAKGPSIKNPGDLEVAGDALVVGISHKTAPASLRDRLYTEEAALPALLAELRSLGLGEAMVVSTCDRTEVQAIAADRDAAAAAITACLAARAGITPAALLAAAYRLDGAAALRHILAVAASLDAAVVGEPQVLGQVKAAHRLAREAGLAGTGLERVMQCAFAAAKRVRSETAIAERAVSIAAVAARLVRDLHGDPARAAGLLVGAGEMGEFLAGTLRQAGMARWTVAHASPRRAELVAHRFGGHFVVLDELEGALARADVVLTALGSGRATIAAPLVRAALRARRQRPILFIDAAVPGDVETEVEAIDGAFLYGLEDLERLALEGRAGRVAAADDGWAIIDAAVASFLSDRAGRQAVPALVALRRHFETAREEILASGGQLDSAEATRRLVNRLLHDPAQALRRLAAEGGDAAAAEALLRRLFDVEDPAAPGFGNDEEKGR